VNKVLAFIWFFVSEPFKVAWKESREIWDVLTKKKTWIFFWALLAFVAIILKDTKTFLFSIVCMFIFFVIYQWQNFQKDYIHEERQKYWKKPKKEGK
jgi:hypothetical protein